MAKANIKDIKLGDLLRGYSGDPYADKVTAWGGRLNIRPAYQRDFVYSEAQKQAVVNSVLDGNELGLLYFVRDSVNPNYYEVMDGQQRILSLCEFFAASSFSMNINGTLTTGRELMRDTQLAERVDNYTLLVYIIDSADSPEEKRRWFNTINRRGEELTEQEIRNASYTGDFILKAREYFATKANTANGAYCSANKCYLPQFINTEEERSKKISASAKPLNRQWLLELALSWVSADIKLTNDKFKSTSRKIDERICTYMSLHRMDEDASVLINYFDTVMLKVQQWFPEDKYTNTDMKSLLRRKDWGILYNLYGTSVTLTADEIYTLFHQLYSTIGMVNGRKDGIIPYILMPKTTEDDRLAADRLINKRVFNQDMKQRKYEDQQCMCPECIKAGIMTKYKFTEMEGDHIQPWSVGGKTVYENLQMLCKTHNKMKSNKIATIDDEDVIAQD